MAQAINTSFDKTVEEDVILEQLDGQAPAVQTTLKNAENVYKSFLYLRKMYSQFPAKESILGMATVSNVDYVQVLVPEGTNYVLINNYSGSSAGIKLDGNEYILQPGEKESFPVVSPDLSTVPVVTGNILELKGSISYVLKNIQEY